MKKFKFIPLLLLASACSLNNVGNTGGMASISESQQVKIMEGNYIPPAPAVGGSASKDRKEIFMRAVVGALHSPVESTPATNMETPNIRKKETASASPVVISHHPVVAVKSNPLVAPQTAKPSSSDLPEINGNASKGI